VLFVLFLKYMVRSYKCIVRFVHKCIVRFISTNALFALFHKWILHFISSNELFVLYISVRSLKRIRSQNSSVGMDMCVYIYICMYVCKYIYVCMCIHVNVKMCVHVQLILRNEQHYVVCIHTSVRNETRNSIYKYAVCVLHCLVQYELQFVLQCVLWRACTRLWGMLQGLPVCHKYVYTYMYVNMTRNSDTISRYILKCVTDMCIYIFVNVTRHSNMHIQKYVYIHISQFLVPFFTDMLRMYR